MTTSFIKNQLSTFPENCAIVFRPIVTKKTHSRHEAAMLTRSHLDVAVANKQDSRMRLEGDNKKCKSFWRENRET